MGKSRTYSPTTSGIKREPWTPQEDKKLVAFIQQHGHGCWRSLPLKTGLQRCGKSCRLRWRNYLNPDIKRGSFSLQEDQTIIRLHALLGNRWSTIAANLPRRTDNEIKNYWNSHLKKRLAKIGFDPITHKPKTAILASTNGGDPKNLSHIAQWESARLQAEVRFARQSKLLHSALPSPTHCYNFNLTTWETLRMSSNTFAAVGGGGGCEEAGTVGAATNFVGNMSSFGDLDAVLGSNISGSHESESPAFILSSTAPDFNELSKESGTSNECDDLMGTLQLQQSYNITTGFDEVVDAWTYLEQCNDFSAYH